MSRRPCAVGQVKERKITLSLGFMTATTIAAVLGANCRRIRTNAGVTQDELARAARRVGLKWTASKVRDFESGRSAPTFATVLALTAALDNATEVKTVAASTSTGHEIAVSLNPAYHPVRLADLVNFDGEVTVTEDFEPSGDHLADFCGGGTWEHHKSVIDWPKLLGLTEQRVAATLGISTERLGAESMRLWNATFSNERDRRAGPDANRQKRGQVTRQLKAELQKAITDGNN
jgi:transcriptional regulator with XRE-family HTH domain